MAALFTDARLKIDRANKHISDLQAAISSVEQRNVATVYEDGQFVKHEPPNLEEALPQLALIVGDAIHNLRVALDYAWASAIERYVPTAVSDHNTFPIRDTRKGVEDALNGIKVDTPQRHALCHAILSDIQPYERGESGIIHALHQLDISDKHLLLLELDPIAGIREISIGNQSGELYEGISVHIQPHKPYILRTRGDLKIQNKGNLFINITIKEAGVFKGVPIFDLLESFRDFVLYTVELLENLSP